MNLDLLAIGFLKRDPIRKFFMNGRLSPREFE